ncbi:hypothetical protein BDC45DRAFT_568221 [Circinella umbellata]|nr:hypothetical protein BDC45DRAFT_568221 [Circinella umbellata]
MTLATTISKSTSTTTKSPLPQRSKSLQLNEHAVLPTSRKPSKKKSSEHQRPTISHNNKRQSRSDSELSKSTTTMLRTPQRRRRSNSAAVVRSNYAGPVFNNAPEPSSLPLPAFLSPQPYHHQQLFLSATPTQLPQRPRTVSFHTIEEHKPRTYFPSKMVTARPPQSSDPSLIELQQRLCSVLKLGASP